jgi:hypothetical protein
MHVTITPEAREFLASKGRQAIRLDAANHRSGGCAMAIAEPVIHQAAPKDPSKYHRLDAEGFPVFVSYILMPKEGEPIEIALQKVLGIRSLVVSGFDSLG